MAKELAAELQAKPDLIIGNYSEGNLVASLLAHKLGVTQVCPLIYLLCLSTFAPKQSKGGLRVFNVVFGSVPLLMHWRKLNTQIRIFT